MAAIVLSLFFCDNKYTTNVLNAELPSSDTVAV